MIQKQIEELRARACTERHAPTALALRVQALELELAALKANQATQPVKKHKRR